MRLLLQPPPRKMDFAGGVLLTKTSLLGMWCVNLVAQSAVMELDAPDTHVCKTTYVSAQKTEVVMLVTA